MNADEPHDDYGDAIELEYIGGDSEYEDAPVDVNHRRARRVRIDMDRNQYYSPDQPPSRWTSFFRALARRMPRIRDNSSEDPSAQPPSFFRALGRRLPRTLAQVKCVFICFIIFFFIMAFLISRLLIYLKEHYNAGDAPMDKAVEGQEGRGDLIMSYVTTDVDSATVIFKKVHIK